MCVSERNIMEWLSKNNYFSCFGWYFTTWIHSQEAWNVNPKHELEIIGHDNFKYIMNIPICRTVNQIKVIISDCVRELFLFLIKNKMDVILGEVI